MSETKGWGRALAGCAPGSLYRQGLTVGRGILGRLFLSFPLTLVHVPLRLSNLQHESSSEVCRPQILQRITMTNFWVWHPYESDVRGEDPGRLLGDINKQCMSTLP